MCLCLWLFPLGLAASCRFPSRVPCTLYSNLPLLILLVEFDLPWLSDHISAGYLPRYDTLLLVRSINPLLLDNGWTVWLNLAQLNQLSTKKLADPFVSTLDTLHWWNWGPPVVRWCDWESPASDGNFHHSSPNNIIVIIEFNRNSDRMIIIGCAWLCL